jgi:hypothetical protein
MTHQRRTPCPHALLVPIMSRRARGHTGSKAHECRISPNLHKVSSPNPCTGVDRSRLQEGSAGTEPAGSGRRSCGLPHGSRLPRYDLHDARRGARATGATGPRRVPGFEPPRTVAARGACSRRRRGHRIPPAAARRQSAVWPDVEADGSRRYWQQKTSPELGFLSWAVTGSNRRPPACRFGADGFSGFRRVARMAWLGGLQPFESQPVSPAG